MSIDDLSAASAPGLAPGHVAADGQTRRKSGYVTVGVASMIGTTIEWYDFFLYGSAAALIFNQIFFPSFDPLTGTLAAFATYSVGFFARPLGGIVFGHFGDRIGRKSMFMITLFLMGIPTILIGLIPAYDSIGYWAAVLLVAMRLLQGLAVGGEWGGAVLMAVEHAPNGKKGLFGSLPQAGVGPGLVLASLAMLWVATLPQEDMLTWGWRIPFLASIVLLFVGWYVRVRVSESPDFEKMKKAGAQVNFPIVEIFRTHPVAVLKVVGARFGEVTWFYTVVTFALSYATTTLGITKATMLEATIWGAIVAFFTMPLMGMLGDRIGHKWVFALGAIGVLVFGFQFFDLLAMQQAFWVNVAMIVAIGVVYAAMYAPEASLFSNQFPPEIRYSGISIGVQLSGAIGGGLAPVVAIWLLSIGDGSPKYVTWYLVLLGLVALISAWSMRSESHTS